MSIDYHRFKGKGTYIFEASQFNCRILKKNKMGGELLIAIIYDSEVANKLFKMLVENEDQ